MNNSQAGVCDTYLVINSIVHKGRLDDIFSRTVRDIFVECCLTKARFPVRFKVIFVASNFLGFGLERTTECRAFFEHLSEYICHMSPTCHDDEP